MAAKKIDVKVFIAQNVGAIARAQNDGETAVGSLLLEGVGELYSRIHAEECEVDIGADYMFAYRNAELARSDKTLLKNVDALDKFARFGMVKLMRVAKERAWHDKFLANVAKLHKDTPIKVTMLLSFGRRIFGGKFDGKELKPVDNCPTVDDLRAWRKAALKSTKKGGKRGAKTDTPADRIKSASDAMAGYEKWLDASMHDHAATVVRELATIAKSIVPAKAKPDAEKIDAIAALRAQLDKLLA